MTEKLTPHFEEVQAHYDLSDDFFRLFLDPTMTYSCAYFDRMRDIPLEEAQHAKMDLALRKLGLRSGMTLLDIGCGWGGTMRRALEKYDVNVIGLTLSEHQAAHVQKMFDEMDTERSKRVLLHGWEEFDEPVDRIVSIGAFEHFGYDRYDDFFAMAHRVLPDDGVMLLHTITMLTPEQILAKGLEFRRADEFQRIHRHRDLPRRPVAGNRDRGVPLVKDGFQPGPQAVAAVALRQDPRHLGRGIGGAPRRGRGDSVRRGLPALHEVSDGLCGRVPRRLHRPQPVHAAEVETVCAL